MLQSLLAFFGAAVLIALAPGPSTVMILRQSVSSGRRAGAVTVLGNETGVLLWGLAAAFGLSALLVASRAAYDGMRLIGAGVLVFFGVRALWQARRARRRPAETADRAATAADRSEADATVDATVGSVGGAAAAGRTRGSLWRSYRLGVVTNLANPKAGVFAVSFLPQFVPDGAPVLGTLVLFSVLWALIDSVWYLGIVWLVSRARAVFQRPSVRRRLEQISGVVLVGLGIRLATEVR